MRLRLYTAIFLWRLPSLAVISIPLDHALFLAHTLLYLLLPLLKVCRCVMTLTRECSVTMEP